VIYLIILSSGGTDNYTKCMTATLSYPSFSCILPAASVDYRKYIFKVGVDEVHGGRFLTL